MKEIELAFVAPEDLKESQRNAEQPNPNGNDQQNLALGLTERERGKEKRQRRQKCQAGAPGLSRAERERLPRQRHPRDRIELRDGFAAGENAPDARRQGHQLQNKQGDHRLRRGTRATAAEGAPSTRPALLRPERQGQQFRHNVRQGPVTCAAAKNKRRRQGGAAQQQGRLSTPLRGSWFTD